MANEDIKRYAAGCGVKQWQIADVMGIQDTNLCKKLRHELPTEKKEEIRAIIKKLSAEAE